MFLGTIVNAAAVVAGGLLGLLFKKGMKPSLEESIHKALGVAVLVLGLNGIISSMFTVSAEGKPSSSGELLLIVSLVLGMLAGELLRIDERLNSFGRRIEQKVGTAGFAASFVNGTLIFCVGAMTIVGALNDGLYHDPSILYVKSMLDAIGAVVFGATLGVGVCFCAIPILLYEGGLTLLAGLLAGALTRTDRVGYVAANPVYGIPAAVNAFALGLKTVRPCARVLLRWACLPDPAHPLDFSDCPDVDIFYAHSRKEPEGTYRDYGLCRRRPDGTLEPLGLPVWKWETFYIEIIRSIFDGTWNNDGSGARAVNYWWGMRSGAEEINYSADLPAGTLQLLDLMEKLLSEDELRIFHGELYAAGHVLHAPEKLIYSPKELMEMDWLDECVDGALPHYDDLDVKTRTLVAINGLANLKKLE